MDKDLTLKERMMEIRGTTETVFPQLGYVMVMLDGRGFSKLIKKKYELPFSNEFIGMMDETAAYLCSNIQNCCFAYTQSDEITLCLATVKEDSESFFGNRLSKILSVTASMAAGKFNQLVISDWIDGPCSRNYLSRMVNDMKLAEFDCKAWWVDNINDVYAYFLWRQIDCIRNSKQQAAQTYLPHKKLMGLDTNKQIELLKKEFKIDWNEYEDYKKYGRFIYKESEHYHNDKLNVDYERSVWNIHPAFPLMDDGGRDKFLALNKIPLLEKEVKK